jgi:hypothetical protein
VRYPSKIHVLRTSRRRRLPEPRQYSLGLFDTAFSWQDGGRSAERKTRIRPPRTIDDTLDISLRRDVGPIVDDGHHAVGANADEDVCPVVDLRMGGIHSSESPNANSLRLIWYTISVAKKKITLETLTDALAKMDARMDRGFASVAEDISNLATKEQIVALHAQTLAIETELRDAKRHKLVTHADLEEKVFGAARD